MSAATMLFDGWLQVKDTINCAILYVCLAFASKEQMV